MSSEEEESLETAISQYEAQLSQIQAAISVTTTEDEKSGLISLCSDISELIRLTQENLLGIKKQKLLSSLPVAPQDALDEEYMLFKAELGDDPTEHLKSEVEKPDIGSDLQALEGMKCQAPYKQQYGIEVSYHNAMVSTVDVSSTEGATQTSDIQVRVIYVNPTQQSMRLCPYYLDSKCRFDEDKCRYSHGQLVPLSELREYKEPDFSSLHRGSRVLARGAGDLWHCALVTDVETSGEGTEHQQDVLHVKFESSGEEAIIEMQSVLPLDDESSSDSDSSEDEVTQDQQETLELANKILMNQGPSIALGAWEKHTKGFGSRLMAQMGYITGTGLGKNAEGKVEPVEALVLPPGRSLDHCMRLKEMSGDKDLFRAEKRQRRQHKKLEKKRQEKYQRNKKKEKGNVFDFINSYLHPNSGPSTSRLPNVTPSQSKPNTPTNLKEDSRRNLNVRTLQLGEDIKKVERELALINQSLVRQGRNQTPASKSIQAKLQAKQNELDELRKEEKSVNSEKNRRDNKHKLVNF